MLHGALIGGATGDADVAAATQWLTGQDVRSPQRLAGILVPGVSWLTKR